MRLLTFATVLLLCFAVCTPSIAASTPQREASLDLPVTVSERIDHDNGYTLTLDFAEPEWNEEEIAGQQLSTAELSMGGMMMQDGMPMVPTAGRMFRIPPRSGVRVEVTSAEYDTYSDVEYAALYGDYMDSETGLLETREDAWYPGNLVQAGDPAIMHDFRVCNLITFPVQVNTARNEVRVYRNIQVSVDFEGEDLRNALPAPPDKISEVYLPYYRMFLDWDDAELDEYTLYRGHVQVVMLNNDALMNLMAPWFEWKRQKGWILDLLTDDDVNNWSHTAIANELEDRYENAETKFDFVVIIGDDTGPFAVPASNGGGGGGGDHNYALVAGNDQLIDVAVSRISIESNAHAQTYVNKVLSYERDVDFDNLEWYDRGFCVSHTNYGISTVFLGRYHRRNMLAIGYESVDTSWIAPWGNGNTFAEASSAINEGISFFASRGHGLGTAQIEQLNNPHMTPVVHLATCFTGDWAGQYSKTEAWIRAGTANSPKGGICASGNATGGTNPRFNQILSYGGGHSAITMRNRHAGDVYFGAKINMYNCMNGLDGGITSFNMWYNQMGDPTVWIWTDTPHVFEIDAAETFELGLNSYTVTVGEAAGGPVANAWVTLYKVDDDEEVIARGITDSNGLCILETPLRHTGEAMLTVTQQNFAPVQIEVDVVSPDNRVGYNEITFQDDGEDGTIGNDNGIPEAGETVGLVVEAGNFGTNDATGISLTASSDDAWVVSATGTIEYDDLAAGEDGAGEGLILIEIAPEAQHEWVLHLDLEFTTDGNTFNDDFAIEVQAAHFVFDRLLGGNNLDPGETANLRLEVMNVGGSDAPASTATIISLDPELGIVDETIQFDPMDIGEDDLSSIFEVAAHVMTIPGRVLRAMAIIVTQDGQVDTTYFSVPVGDKDSHDPMGPDSYGYHAFDDTDNGYELAPEYEWVEISSEAGNPDFDGIELQLSDNGDDQDDAVRIDLPFTIQYYGERFDEATVCSNGWIAMGNQADVGVSRNYAIPSGGGPNYMIAPYWDELFLNTGGVYSYYDEANGRFIVEWYHTTGYQGGGPNTFQVIFYTQDERPTFSEDNEFVFQYHTVNHVQGGQFNTSADTYWWTTGIENGNQTDGLQYSYWNTNGPGAAPITEERAILFSTNIYMITGTIQGNVTDLETGEPMEDALVSTDNYVYTTRTDAEGNYTLEEVMIGIDHIVVAERIGYNRTRTDFTVVSEDDTTIINFSLAHPEFGIDTNDLEFNMNAEDSQTQQITMSNSGNGDLEYSFRVLFTDPAQMNGYRGGDLETGELDDPWDPHFNFDLTDEETRNRAVTFYDGDFWVAGSVNNDIGDNKFYRYSKDGEYIGEYIQPVTNHSSSGFFDLTSSDDFMFAGDRGTIYKMAFNGEVVEAVDEIDSPVNNIRCIAYDSGSDLLWISGRIDETLYAIDMDGDIQHSYDVEDLGMRGLGIHPDDEVGFILYFILEDTDANVFSIVKMHPQTGEIIPVHELGFDGSPTGGDLTNRFNPLIWTYMTVMDEGNQDHVQVWEIDLNSRWIDIDPMIGVVVPDGNGTVDVEVIANNFPEGVFSAWLELNHNSIEQQHIIPLTLEVGQVNDLHFTSVDPTGIPYSIIFDDALYNGEQLSTGDEIGLFDGELCVGAYQFDQDSDFPLPTTAWEGDEANNLPGYLAGNPIVVRFWIADEMVEVEAVVEVVQGNGAYGFGPYAQLSASADFVGELEIPLQANYFELISFNRQPENLNVAAIFADIEALSIVYQNDGSIYIPPFINTIGDVDLSQGYQVFVEEADILVVDGAPVDPAIDINLITNQWNWMGYPLQEPLEVTIGLGPVADNLVIVQNDDGHFWIPNLINTLGEMVPGEGYFAFVDEDITFQYNLGGMARNSDSDHYVELPELESAPQSTGLPYIVLVNIDEQLLANNPATIELYDGNTLVGKSVVMDELEYSPVVTWQGSDERGLDGFVKSNPIQVVLRNEEGVKIPVSVVNAEDALFGKGAYSLLNLEGNGLPTEFAVEQGYPNPFNPSVTIPYALPASGEITFAVYNVLGQQVYNNTVQQQAGYHRFIFDANQSGRELVSGMYFLKADFNGKSVTQKLMMLK